MQIYSQLAPLALGGAHGSAVAMGFFDGIHIGHRAVINGAVEWAKAHGAAPAVFTFRLPTENKMKGKRLLSTEDKHALIAERSISCWMTSALIPLAAQSAANAWLSRWVPTIHTNKSPGAALRLS